MKGVTVSNLALVFLVSMYASVAQAQSLGEIARQEEARRKAIKTSGKVYTNDSLRSEPVPAVPSAPARQAASQGEPEDPQGKPEETPAAPSSTPAQAEPPAAVTPPPGGAAAAAGAPMDEASWRKRVETARTALSRAQMFAVALQTRIDALSTDFVNRDDPAQRSVVAADRDEAVAELARVRQEIQQHQKAIVAMQDEARRAAVPAGWVR